MGPRRPAGTSTRQASAGDPAFARWWAPLPAACGQPRDGRRPSFGSRPRSTSATYCRRCGCRPSSSTAAATGDLGRSRARADVAEHIPGARFVELAGRRPPAVRRRYRRGLLGEIESFLTGARVRRRRPSAATVLFTDIVGSTERASELGDRRWRSTCSRPRRAVRSSSDASEAGDQDDRRRLPRDLRRTGPRPCGARTRSPTVGSSASKSGPACTPARSSSGDDVGGMAVNIGARSARWPAREVLVSSTVKDLIAGSGLEFQLAARTR